MLSGSTVGVSAPPAPGYNPRSRSNAGIWIRGNDTKEHRDPADRFIVTTARRLNGVLVTCDEEILEYARQGHVAACDAR